MSSRRDRNGGPRRLGDAMPRVLGRLGAPTSLSTMEIVFSRWPEVAGDGLAEHLRPLRVDGAVLVVAADHPAWATRARLESAQILARVKGLGDTVIERMEVVVERP
jgi:predicted nucleic acid-binding Zn ribbon protein